MRDDIEAFLRRRETAILAVIVLVALLVRLKYAYISGMWVDEGRYAVIATSLLEHPLRFMSPYHGVITNYPPVFPYMLMLSMLVLGWGKTAVYTVSPVMGAVGVAAVYFLGRELFGEHEGLVAAALLAFSPVYFFLSERILIGVTLTVLYTASMALLYYGLEDRTYSRYALWALGPVAALSLLTKQPAYLMGPVFAIYFVLKEGRDILELREDPLKYRDLYIGVLLGLVTLAPWFLRNIGVCGSILCSSSKAVGAIFNTDPADWANTGGPLYYVLNLSALVGIPVAALFYLRYVLGEAWLDLVSRDIKKVGKVVVPTLLASIVAFFILPRTVPFVLLLGLALLQDSREEQLLWLWIAFGVGFMSTVTIKVPRYIIFVVPAILLLTAKLLVDARDTVAEYVTVDRKVVTGALAVVVLLIAGFSAWSSVRRVTTMSSGFQQLEPAGEWFRGKEDADVLASSPRQILFYSKNGPNVTIMSREPAEVNRSIRSGTYEYVVADLYERTRQQSVMFLLRNFQQRGGLLTPVQVYRQGGRPVVVIYRVNTQQ